MDAFEQRILCVFVLLTLYLNGVVISEAPNPSAIRYEPGESTTSHARVPASPGTRLSGQVQVETHSGIETQSVNFVGVKESPCLRKHDPRPGGGIFVDCSHRGLTKIESDWFPPDTTRIDLDYNNIGTLVNCTFCHLKELRSLNISSSNISKIEVDALKDLENLETLDLEKNILPLAETAFPPGMFRHIPNLVQLFIAYNNKENMRGSGYPNHTDIFDHLPKLQALSIDAFETLYLGHEFEKFQNLTSLVLFCGATMIVRNDSFEGLNNIKLKHLEMREFSDEPFYLDFQDRTIHFQHGVFENLPYLDSLTLYICPIGNRNLLKSLRPFQSRNMTSLQLTSTAFPHHYSPPDKVFEDGIIYKEDIRDISDICVSHFTWRDSRLYAISPEALYNTGLMRCIKTLDLSGNPMQPVEWLSFYYATTLCPKLEIIIFEIPPEVPQISDKHGFLPPFSRKRDSASRNSYKQTSMNDDIFLQNYNISEDEDNQKGHLHDQKIKQWSHPSVHMSKMSVSHEKQYAKENHSSTNISDMEFILPYITLYMPVHMRTLRFDSFNTLNILNLWRTIYFVADDFTELVAINMPTFVYGSGKVVGLHNLTIMDISGSMFHVEDYFWDEFPGMQHLTVRNVKPDDFFTRIPCKRLIRNMPKLTHLDISDNGLNWLEPGTFLMTPKLSYLNLAKNRFSNIPFDLSSTPKLRVLDLTENAILFLTEEEMAAIDTHLQGVESFLLKLQGNVMLCVCSRLQFLAWQQRTLVNFDKDGNYSCTTEDGHMTSTADIGGDIEGFWRQCQGKFMLMVSLVLVSLMAVTILTTYLVGRFRTAMVAFLLRVFAPRFRPMSSADYKTDVFIGYADDDYRFVRHVLSRYLEEDLHVKTFIHQRDFRQGYEGEQFFHAIQNSWRVLLVITETFLQRYNMADIVMKFASLSVTPVNQGRVFVVAEESQVHAIPKFLHDVLDDTRIIVLHDLNQEKFEYEQKQSIKSCLLPVN